MWKPLYEISGVQFYAKRRRYGTVTYTWVGFKPTADAPMEELPGDPWPCITPKRTEVMAEYANATMSHK